MLARGQVAVGSILDFGTAKVESPKSETPPEQEKNLCDGIADSVFDQGSVLQRKSPASGGAKNKGINVNKQPCASLVRLFYGRYKTRTPPESDS
jgi:hypothetical protein